MTFGGHRDRRARAWPAPSCLSLRLLVELLADAFLPLPVDRPLELLERAADIVVAGKQLLQARQVVRNGDESSASSSIDGIAALFLGKLRPLRQRWRSSTPSLIRSFCWSPKRITASRTRPLTWVSSELKSALCLRSRPSSGARTASRGLPELVPQFAGDACIGKRFDVLAVRLQLPQGPIKAIVQRTLYLKRPFQVVVEGRRLRAQALRRV